MTSIVLCENGDEPNVEKSEKNDSDSDRGSIELDGEYKEMLE